MNEFGGVVKKKQPPPPTRTTTKGLLLHTQANSDNSINGSNSMAMFMLTKITSQTHLEGAYNFWICLTVVMNGKHTCKMEIT